MTSEPSRWGFMHGAHDEEAHNGGLVSKGLACTLEMASEKKDWANLEEPTSCPRTRRPSVTSTGWKMGPLGSAGLGMGLVE